MFPLKHFFSSSVACTAEERRHALSSLAIKDRIKDLVAQEDRRTPLSDATITAILNGEGVDIKRRTVAKYREALGIGRSRSEDGKVLDRKGGERTWYIEKNTR